MPVLTNIYRVHYGYFVNGKLASVEYVDDVLAADGKEATLKAVLANNNKTQPGTTLQILAVVNSGPHGGDNGGRVLS